MTEKEANEIANEAIRLYNAMEEILRNQNISDTAFHVLGVMTAILATKQALGVDSRHGTMVPVRSHD